MKFNKITDDIIHVIMPDRKSLASCMIRIQEYYESPFPDIRGQVFTLGQVRAKGSRNMPGVNTYEGGNFFDADWSGYNWPSYCLEPFIKGLFDPLTEYEQDLVEALRYKPGKFYVIGTYGDDDPGDTLMHEIAHAMYYINADYKKEVDEVLSQYNLTNLKACLESWGYAKEVLDDECHAYMGPDYDWFFSEKKDDIKKFDIDIDKSISEKLLAILSKYYAPENK